MGRGSPASACGFGFAPKAVLGGLSTPSYVPSPVQLEDRYKALFRVSQAISAHRDPEELFHVLASELRHVVQFHYISVAVYDEQSNELCCHLLDTGSQPGVSPPSDFPPEERLSWWVFEHQIPLVIPFVDRETRFARMMQFLRQQGIQSSCALPLTTAHRRIGCLGLGSKHEDAYREDEVGFLSLVAGQVALAIDDALNFEVSQRAQAGLQREKDRLKLLLDVNNTVVSNLELRDLLRAISASVRRVMNCDVVNIMLPDSDSGQLRLYAQDFPEGKGFMKEENLIPADSPPGRASQTGKPVVLGCPDLTHLCPAGPAAAEGLKSGCLMPLVSRNGVLGVLGLARRHESAFSDEDVNFLTQVASQVVIAMENARAYREIASLRDQLAQEKLYLEDEIRSELNFEEIVGQSAALRRVLQQVETVAPTDSTVLIYGETGTGKELIARAIHSVSSRRANPFVKLNCAAIPAGLLESELFGHEKGSFTGAVSQRIGRFELGHHGTVFLDEVGEISLELQPKLLRVLQEREFERLGSTRTLRTDTRLIAASNRDLSAMVEEQKFRMDLFYRLNVFPVHVPPLRERQEDIPVLVRHFVQQFARRMHKTIDTIPSETMRLLGRYHWPGNIRELQNLIERAVILSSGRVLRVPHADLRSRAAPANAKNHDTLQENERKHLLAVLEDTKWVLGGPNGAAARLGLKRSTLQFRMRKLGIARPGT
jgi:formate hydrogenlyase transcriptional activator